MNAGTSPPNPRPLRVVLAPSAYYPHVGGIEELTRQLALALGSRGHEVSVLTNRWPEGVSRDETLDGVAVTRLRFPLPAARPRSAARFLATAPAAAVDLLRELRKGKPDVLHVVGAGPQSVYLGLLARLHRVPIVFTAQGELTFDAHDVFRRSTTLRLGLRRMLRSADAVTACSAFVMRDLQAEARFSAPSQVVPNGVDPDEFATGESEEGLGSYVLAVGRLVPQKGFDVLLDAFASLERSDLSLVLAGDGFERRALEERAERLKLTSRVRFLGAVDRERLGRLLRGATLFAFPSRDEPFGIALLEAMAADIPAVAAAAGGVPEFATGGENALLAAPEDASALAAAIAQLLDDEQLRKRVVRGGKNTARELSWANIARRYEEIYLTAVAKRCS